MFKEFHSFLRRTLCARGVLLFEGPFAPGVALVLSSLPFLLLSDPAWAYPDSVNWFPPNRISGSLRENGEVFPGCNFGASRSETGVGSYTIVLGGTRVYALGPASSSTAVCNVSMPVFSSGTHVPTAVSVEWETRVAKTASSSLVFSFDANWLEPGFITSQSRVGLPNDGAVGTSPLAPVDRRFFLNAVFPRSSVDRMKTRFCRYPEYATLDMRFVVSAHALHNETWAVAMSQLSGTDLSLGTVRVSFRQWEACPL